MLSQLGSFLYRMSERSPLLPGSSHTPSDRIGAGHASKPGHVSIWRVGCVFILLVIPLFLLADVELPDIPWFGRSPRHYNMCPQVQEMHPKSKVATKVLDAIETPEFLVEAVGALSGAVKIAWVSVFSPHLLLLISGRQDSNI
jgi:hypothetical protein